MEKNVNKNNLTNRELSNNIQILTVIINNNFLLLFFSIKLFLIIFNIFYKY